MGFILGYLFIVGIFVGSFYNVVSLRLCKNESIIFPGSHCVNCNHRLAWYELIPVFSYIGLRGKCKNCHQHISLQYPLIELLTGLLFMGSFWLFGFSYKTLISIILCSIVIITFITDIKYMIILDEVLISGGIGLIIVDFFAGGMTLVLKQIGAGLLIMGIMLLVKLLGDRAFKQESLGWGDVKLSFIAGLALGIPHGILYIILGSFLAFPYAIYISVKNKESMLPFGPFLAASMLILYWNFDLVANLIALYLGV